MSQTLKWELSELKNQLNENLTRNNLKKLQNWGGFMKKERVCKVISLEGAAAFLWAPASISRGGRWKCHLAPLHLRTASFNGASGGLIPCPPRHGEACGPAPAHPRAVWLLGTAAGNTTPVTFPVGSSPSTWVTTWVIIPQDRGEGPDGEPARGILPGIIIFF